MSAWPRAGTALAATFLLAATTLAACSSDSGGDEQPQSTERDTGSTPPDLTVSELLDEIRAATVQYHDIEVALTDGFAISPDVPDCVDNMGYHYFNEGSDLEELDPLSPNILVYAPDGNGDLQLVAVEYGTTYEQAEETFGIEFDPPGGMPFLTLHAWVWLGNPDGTFTSHNPLISCDD